MSRNTSLKMQCVVLSHEETPEVQEALVLRLGLVLWKYGKFSNLYFLDPRENKTVSMHLWNVHLFFISAHKTAITCTT